MRYFRKRRSRARLAAAIAFRRSALTCALLLAALPAWSQANPSAPNPFVEELRQQEREKALRAAQEKDVDVRLPSGATTESRRLPETESPCFRIDHLVLAGELSESFQWALQAAAGLQGDDTPIGRCLGTSGVNIVLARLQQAVIARGYVTTRVLAAPQDLSTATLTLTLIPGRIAAIRTTPDSSPRAKTP